MRLATIRVPGGTRAVRLDGGQAVETGHNDAGELLAHQGKSFEATTPVGPALVTPDELPGGIRPALAITGGVDGETVQKADTSDLVFDPVALVRYISAIMTLRPGDLIATGTPGGVGHARKPPRYLTAGMTLTTEIEGIGRLENAVRAS
jgi:acylpyruvate hydrolase